MIISEEMVCIWCLIESRQISCPQRLSGVLIQEWQDPGKPETNGSLCETRIWRLPAVTRTTTKIQKGIVPCLVAGVSPRNLGP